MKRLLLVTLLFCLNCLFVWGQYNIKYEDEVLSSKERANLEKVIDFQLKFYNNARLDSLIKASDVKLYIYTDYSAFLLHQKEQMKTTLHRSMGFYSSKNKEAVVCKDKNETRFMKTCYHELSHFFTNTYFSKIPIWLNEGLSEYFSEMKVTAKEVKHIKKDRNIARVKTMIKNRDIDLKNFINWDRQRFYKMSFAHDGYGYALGYSIVLFLMEQHKDMVPDYMGKMASEKDSAITFDQLYGGGFGQFEKDFLSYISKQ
ncbi:DUF1570 domain-containing protein [Dysgonomonas sp. 520]|uniref:DUF1570 domain-containing protein n=1 Tax=Dysgonomonas sp. 520 TaxID=2302931 RepID=UPI0013D470C0|nr:DUF1570 domain-containing protein [Dysgonomonas sp. 520]NDW08500.1 DUF1570 domain-containing protein [Dysgonomonas sp. 520]